ncbi:MULTISPECIES: NAD(+)--rifampin ADP-ribosyltransferase [Aeromicrobium]|uniref:NAD(+)--rifampin ADP-ribosyltransferase n=1 Tax=Aeromicrobium TaxID=2040 RepID=UPI00257C7A78|nr:MULTISPECIES: NAD(+)--rifampin ADP-ribosyltransferase [Aeromicrobium]
MSDDRLGPDDGPFFHGTKAVLSPGDLLEPGRRANFGENRTAGHIYFTGTLDAATWGAELSVGEGRGHIYRVEPTGPFEDDPNLTDKKFPGNPTRSYRSKEPIRVVEEVVGWEPHPPEVLQHMLDSLAAMKERGEVVIDD